jgi:hypothetical protein
MDTPVLPFDLQDPREQLGQHGKCRYLTTGQGLRLCAHYWPTAIDSPKGIVIACHGHGCYTTFEFLKLKVRITVATLDGTQHLHLAFFAGSRPP